MRSKKSRHALVPGRIGKTGVVLCCHCRKLCKDEVFTDTHRFLGEVVDTILDFCSPECKFTYYWDEEIIEEVARRLDGVEKKVEQEIRWFQAHGICPNCKRRILERLHSCR